jgi:Periplasmic copper-binding protein (NosD)
VGIEPLIRFGRTRAVARRLTRLAPLLACGLVVLAGCSGDTASSGASAESAAATGQVSASTRAALRASCDRFASPHGSRQPTGSRAKPFGSLAQLVRSLHPGQVGCLMPGRFRHRGVVRLEGARTTIRSFGRPRAAVDGAVWVEPAARGARIAGLRLTSHDPEFSIPLKIQADDVKLVGNDITATRSISCVLVGSSRTVSGLLIEDNRIHHCGRSGKHDHLLYMAHSRNAVIRRNLLVDNRGGWAVHLYPDADGTLVESNVIDSNEGGVIFAGSGDGQISEGNLVRSNVITNSSPRWNIESSWSGGPIGQGNVASRNCLFSTGPGAPSGFGPNQGFKKSDNAVAPGAVYVDRRAGDYRLRRGSRCAALIGSAGGAALRLGH